MGQPSSVDHIFETQRGPATMLDGIRFTFTQHLRIGCVLACRSLGGPSGSGFGDCSAGKGRKLFTAFTLAWSGNLSSTICEMDFMKVTYLEG